MSEVRGVLLKVLLLTAQRRYKVLTINWAHLVDNIWLIRTEKREKGNAGTLVLPQVVLELIEQQPRIAGDPRVFATAGSLASRKQDLNRIALQRVFRARNDSPARQLLSKFTAK